MVNFLRDGGASPIGFRFGERGKQRSLCRESAYGHQLSRRIAAPNTIKTIFFSKKKGKFSKIGIREK